MHAAETSGKEVEVLTTPRSWIEILRSKGTVVKALIINSNFSVTFLCWIVYNFSLSSPSSSVKGSANQHLFWSPKSSHLDLRTYGLTGDYETVISLALWQVVLVWKLSWKPIVLHSTDMCFSLMNFRQKSVQLALSQIIVIHWPWSNVRFGATHYKQMWNVSQLNKWSKYPLIRLWWSRTTVTRLLLTRISWRYCWTIG